MNNAPDSKGLWWKIALPIIIGLGVVIWLFNSEFNAESISEIRFTPRVWVCIGLALLAVVGRDGGMAWRFRVLTDGELSWKRAVNVTMLCEFTSAITPSSVGGSALSMFFLGREGIKMGRATTLTMTILFLDELFFVVFTPIVFLLIPYDELFGFGSKDFVEGVKIAFWIFYSLIFLWTVVLFVGIILRPSWIRSLIIKLFSFRLLRRWKDGATEFGDNMVATSRSIRERSLGWWVRGFAATTLSWVSRYLVVNALILGFVATAPQAVVFCRQIVIWTLLMFSPTPGGSGVSEWLFREYYGDIISVASIVMILALLWRLLTYYLYLAVGVILLPSFIRKKKK
ncbi:MAG: flippase-like domain-containing protein [Muribaculaceae bacterium]|nr:flippase-like domain-containing protein [Muribaculaceae bacterium]